MATYTVQAGDTWTSLARRLGVDARTLRQQNRGTSLSQGVVIRTGGATYTRPADINPWGLPAGEVPAYAAGTAVANTYLAAIGQPTTEEVPGVTPIVTTTDERPPAELAPQALMPGPEQLAAPTVAPTEIGEPIDIEALAGAGIGPAPPTAPFYPGIAQPEGGIDLAQALAPTQVTPAEYPPFYPGIGQAEPGPTLAPTQVTPEEYPPFYPGVGYGLPGATGFQPNAPQLEPTAAPPGAEYVVPTPSISDATTMPTEQYVSSPTAIAQAAIWSSRAIAEYNKTGNRNFLPNVLTSPVATLILSQDIETYGGETISTLQGLFSDEALGYTEIESGVWVKNPELTYSGGYGGSIGYTGRRRGRGRGARGGGFGRGGTQYGPRLVQWRIRGFG